MTVAIINDNDFGLEGNTHVQIALVQLKNTPQFRLSPFAARFLNKAHRQSNLKNKIDVDKGILPGGDCIKLKKYSAGSR